MLKSEHLGRQDRMILSVDDGARLLYKKTSSLSISGEKWWGVMVVPKLDVG